MTKSGRELLHLARLPDAAADLLGALACSTQPRDRDVRVPRQRLGHGRQATTCASRCASSRREEDLITIHHELGHVYYYLCVQARCRSCSRTARNDGFHEAIGDTVNLSMTPAYLQQIGLIGAVKPSAGSDRSTSR